MPNVRVAAVHGPLLSELLESLSTLPEPLVDDVVVTEHLVHPCISDPTALSAASAETTDTNLELVLEAIRRAKVIIPDDWRYQPSLKTRTPWREVSFYGLEDEETHEIAGQILVGMPSYFVVLTKVTDLWLRPSPYVEIRVPHSEDPLMLESALRVANGLNQFLDIELFSATADGTPKMDFWPKGAENPLP